MAQFFGVLCALVVGGLLMLHVELRMRAGRSRKQSRDGDPVFRTQRNGRVRFDLEDLRRSAPASQRPAPHPEVETTMPDLRCREGFPEQRRKQPGGRVGRWEIQPPRGD
ncbi:MAG: hypothetical protein ACRDTE_04295 [Pseudonocardiaceae bacterium]